MRALVRTLLLLAIALPAVPQEGHPLTGTWTGDAGSDSTNRRHLTLVLNWDGKAITGLLNPGPDSAPLRSITLDPASWTVRFEAQTKDANGQASTLAAEGKIENLGSIHRTIKGTWKQGTATGDFRLTRD